MNEPGTPPAHRHVRVIVLAVAAVCVLALAAGAFALSYPGARATAVNAGVSGDLARVYPGIFGAVLLVACAAALVLRGAWRFFAWLVVLVVIGAVAAADTVHALSIALPRRPMEVTAAAAPWAALVIGLLLLDAMARQSRPRRNAVPPGYVAGPGLSPTAQRHRSAGQPDRGSVSVPLSALLAVARPETPVAAPPAPHPAGPPVTQPAARPATHPIQPTARLITQPTAQQPWQPASRQAAETAARPAGQPGAEAATKPQTEAAVKPAEAEPPKPPQPGPGKPAGTEPAGTGPAKSQHADASKPTAAEPGKPQEPLAGEQAKAEPQKPADVAEPAGADPAKLPEPGPPRPGDRDEPSDVDAEPAGPGTLFSWLRRSRTAPGETPGNGTPEPSKEPAAPSTKAASDTA